MDQPRRSGDILKSAAAQIVIKEGNLRTFGMQVAGECVAKAFPQTVFAPVILGVFADIGNKQVEQSVAVVVEKRRSRGMSPGPLHSSRFGNVREMPMTIIVEENVPFPDAGHKQVGIAVVV